MVYSLYLVNIKGAIFDIYSKYALVKNQTTNIVVFKNTASNILLRYSIF